MSADESARLPSPPVAVEQAGGLVPARPVAVAPLPPVLAEVAWRRRLGLGIAVLATVPGLMILLANVNPWRFTYLLPLQGLSRALWLTVVICVDLVVAGFVGLNSARAVRMALLPAGLVLALVVCVCGLDYIYRMMPGSRESTGVWVVAVSADGRIEVVEQRYGSDGDSDEYEWTLAIRTRAGLLSRESAQLLADVWTAVSVPDNTDPDTIRFVAPREVEVRIADGRSWRTAIDPRRVPAYHLVNCGPSGDVCWLPTRPAPR